MAISPSASSRSSAPYSVPARSSTRSLEIRLMSWMIPYPCCGPWASAVRIRNVVSCIARLLMWSLYTVELTIVCRTSGCADLTASAYRRPRRARRARRARRGRRARRARRGRPPPLARGLDVLVDVEGVVRVVAPLDLGEPVVVAPVGGPDPVIALGHHEVDVRTAGRGRVQFLPVV